MAVASIVENVVKFREGKKWKERFCILKKPSPVADCLSVMLYKDTNKQMLKTNIVLDEFCGIETTPFDGEKYILSVICCNKTLLLSFVNGELRDLWKEKLQLNFGEDICFKVEVIHGLADQRSSGLGFMSNHSHLCNFFLTSSRMSLTTRETSSVILKHLCSWRYTDLKRYGLVGKNSYGIQVLFKEGEKNFVLKTHQSADIDKALKSKVQSLVQSCGLFEQLICSISVTTQSAFPASASNPSTPTYCISSESSKLMNYIDRRFSNPHSQMPPKSQNFCNSLENTSCHASCRKQIPAVRNGSFCDTSFPEQLNNSLIRHFSECSLHMSVQSDHNIPIGNLNTFSSYEGPILHCMDPKDKLNYINYEACEYKNSSRSEDLLNKDNEPFCIPSNNSLEQAVMSSEMKLVTHLNDDSCANIAMMNGGFCANKSVTFDPLQPLPYRDLSRYDGESDEGYLYWLPGSPKRCNAGYINVSSVEAKEVRTSLVRSTVASVDEYLNPSSSLDSLQMDSLKFECFPGSSSDPSTSSYVNVSGIAVMNNPSEAIPDDNKENHVSGGAPRSSFETNNNDYIHINQLGSGAKCYSIIKSISIEEKNPLGDYMDMTGRQELEEEMTIEKAGSETYHSCKEPTNSKMYLDKEIEGGLGITCSSNVSDMDVDLIKKIHMSPPPPVISRQLPPDPQEYINLSSVSIGEPSVCLSPPPRPPKLLNCIREDASESSIPPPLPEKVKHQRGIIDQDFAPLPIPLKRRDQSDSHPKPPLPRRTSHSPVNLHSSPPPGSIISHHNRGSTLSFCLPNTQAHLGSRPVSASSIQRHRKPNLTVDIKNATDVEHGKLDTPISISLKWHPDDLNRSLPALAIYKPRNGKEYVDRRRLAEESMAPSLPPHSAQRSPSVVSSVFTFDDKSLSSNPLSGWYSSGEDSPKYPSSAISVRSSMRSMLDQKRPICHREISCNGSPCSYRFDCLESPRTFSTGTVDSVDTVINYADIDVLPGDFCFDQSKFKFVATSPPLTPDNRTVYAKIDVAATSAACKVGKQHAKQREDTLEKRAEGVVLTKLQSCDGCTEKRKLSLDLKKQSSLSIKD